VDDVPEPAEASKIERFAQLLATCQRQVFVYAMGLLHNAADAEEVLQETNLVLWRKFDQFHPGTEFGRWACGIAHFEVLKRRQKKVREERLLSDEFIDMLATQPIPTSEMLEARREALARCLGKLSPQDRQLVASRYQAAATTRSAAETLGRSVQGTRKALHRIRLALMACIQRSIAREEPA
jgi:RNA polymerase sigma-70 factor (ECF subfamily)